MAQQSPAYSMLVSKFLTMAQITFTDVDWKPHNAFSRAKPLPVLSQVIKRGPDVTLFSCWLWKIPFVTFWDWFLIRFYQRYSHKAFPLYWCSVFLPNSRAFKRKLCCLSNTRNCIVYCLLKQVSIPVRSETCLQ